MAYVAPNYLAAVAAMKGKWVCSRASSLGPYDDPPPEERRGSPDYCGQCVSFVTRMCPTIPVGTIAWKKGELARDAKDIKAGTAIATFNSAGRYSGHAAIFVRRESLGLRVYDQWITGSGKAIGEPRLLRYGAGSTSNNGSLFHVVE